MGKVKLLDCTLRDGGYINDWKFENCNIVSIFKRLVNANIDIIEIGFIDDRRPFDNDRSIMPNTDCISEIYGKLDKKNSEIVGMIDYGTCDIKNIKPCSESYIDGIRVIFKKHLMHEAMEYCRKLKELGYKVYSQLVSITSYNDNELLELVDLANDVKPYAVSMVDTYGLLQQEELLHYYKILDNKLNTDINIGFHAHNNLQLAYANVLAFLNYKGNHNIIVDGTLYGMGKSAGNAPLELIAMTLKEKYNKKYNINSLLESIAESIIDFYSNAPWGYNIFFYLSSLNKCHPNYVNYFRDKDNLSISKINNLLAMIEPDDKKLLYDKEVAEQIYSTYIKTNGSDENSKRNLKIELQDKRILVIGPGKNTFLQRKVINEFIQREKPYVISINCIPDNIKIDSVFITNSIRYKQMTTKKEKTIATSNVECKNGKFDYVVNRSSLIEEKEKIKDNSYLMFIKLISSLGIKQIICAGFDGYSDKDDNYYNPSMEYSFVKKEAENLNRHVRKALLEYKKNINIEFLTYSKYDEQNDDLDSYF